MAKKEKMTTSVPEIRKVPFDAPWRWLASGWRDIFKAPGISLTYGAFIALISVAILVGLYMAGGAYLILPLAGGFLLLGPMIAVGLYETSRRLQAGEDVELSDVTSIASKSPSQLAFMGVFLLIIYFVWLEIAFLLFMLFLGPEGIQVQNLVPTLLLTTPGIGLLAVGTAAGAVLALLVFAVTAISIPLLMRREIDAVTAAMSSIQAVAINPQAMLLWAVLIAAMIAFAFATLFVGMILIFPLIGHATWHAYRALVVAPEA